MICVDEITIASKSNMARLKETTSVALRHFYGMSVALSLLCILPFLLLSPFAPSCRRLVLLSSIALAVVASPFTAPLLPTTTPLFYSPLLPKPTGP